MKKPPLLQSLTKRAIGDAKERVAARFLRQQGVQLIARNFNGPRGEIDLIVEHEGYLIFIETRYRKDASFGGAAASVSASKQGKVIATAQHYLQSHPKWQRSPCRFDVIAIEGESINWIKDAFQLE